jgi:hypothetical protein
MAMFGREWVLSDSQPLTPETVQEQMKWLADRAEARGEQVILTRTLLSDEESHWMIDCESAQPHAHLYLRWKSSDESA